MGCHPSHWRTHIFQDGHIAPPSRSTYGSLKITKNHRPNMISQNAARPLRIHLLMPWEGFLLVFLASWTRTSPRWWVVSQGKKSRCFNGGISPNRSIYSAQIKWKTAKVMINPRILMDLGGDSPEFADKPSDHHWWSAEKSAPLQELEGFRRLQITPVFIFQGMTPGPKHSMFVNRSLAESGRLGCRDVRFFAAQWCRQCFTLNAFLSKN